MHCHGQANSAQENGHKKHSWMMWCCIIPMGLAAVALLVGYRSVLTGFLPLLCPLMMVGMMLFMGKGPKHREHESPAGSQKADHSQTL